MLSACHIYAGGEGYTQSLKESGDIDKALLRYLGNGGLIVVIPSQPFPFYYNEKGETVASAYQFGLPIGTGGTGNWESPPDGLDLTFQTDDRQMKIHLLYKLGRKGQSLSFSARAVCDLQSARLIGRACRDHTQKQYTQGGKDDASTLLYTHLHAHWYFLCRRSGK